MGFVTSTQFVVLINGATLYFLKTSKGLRQGFQLLPHLFLLIVEGLSQTINYAKI